MAILGPTAAGKSKTAVEIAERIGGEILSVDSMQVYRGMDIGTAKPTLEERRGITHHMIDLVDPEDEFSVAEFRRHGRKVMEEAEVPLVITGGSGFHFRALVDPMSFPPTDSTLRRELEQTDPGKLVAELTRSDPEAGRHIDLANVRRVIRAVEVKRLSGLTPSQRATSVQAAQLRDYVPEVGFTAVGIDPGEAVGPRIEARIAEMRTRGLVEEVWDLRDRFGRTASGAVGYKELLAHFDGQLNEDQAFEQVVRNTRKLAKRQRTWFRRDPRILWIPWADDDAERAGRVMEILS